MHGVCICNVYFYNNDLGPHPTSELSVLHVKLSLNLARKVAEGSFFEAGRHAACTVSYMVGTLGVSSQSGGPLSAV